VTSVLKMRYYLKADSCAQANEASGSIKSGQYLNYVRDC